MNNTVATFTECTRKINGLPVRTVFVQVHNESLMPSVVSAFIGSITVDIDFPPVISFQFDLYKRSLRISFLCSDKNSNIPRLSSRLFLSRLSDAFSSCGYETSAE